MTSKKYPNFFALVASQRNLGKFFYLFASFVILAASASALDISRHGITWTINGSPANGTYANGDPWVVGPVTITKITPGSTVTSSGRTINGTMINPQAAEWPQHGFDSKMSEGTGTNWNSGLNAGRPGGNTLSDGNPLSVAAGSSVCSSISHPTDTQRPTLTDFSVLTVVASAPAAGSFRPPYCGTDKTHYWNKSQLNYSILRNLNPVSGANTPDGMAGSFNRPWVEIATQQMSYTGFRASNNQPHYGRDMDQLLGSGLLTLHLNYTNAQKEALYVRLVQYGLDVYGAWKSNNAVIWQDEAGIIHGQKAPVVLAGMALNDSKIAALGSMKGKFSIDRQTWYVTQSDVGRTLQGLTNKPAPTRQYNQSDVGVAEWGIKHTSSSQYDNPDWGAVYRDVVYHGSYGTALFAHLTPGMKTAWNHNPHFDYFDRVHSISGSAAGTTFQRNMWNAYRYNQPPINPPVDPVVPTAPTGLRVLSQ